MIEKLPKKLPKVPIPGTAKKSGTVLRMCKHMTTAKYCKKCSE